VGISLRKWAPTGLAGFFKMFVEFFSEDGDAAVETPSKNRRKSSTPTRANDSLDDLFDLSGLSDEKTVDDDDEKSKKRGTKMSSSDDNKDDDDDDDGIRKIKRSTKRSKLLSTSTDNDTRDQQVTSSSTTIFPSTTFLCSNYKLSIYELSAAAAASLSFKSVIKVLTFVPKTFG
jgi:hypothetical protein